MRTPETRRSFTASICAFVLALTLHGATARAQSLAASGISHDVPVASLTGWAVCYSDTYDVHLHDQISTIQAACTGPNLLVACRPTGAANLQLAAHAPRADVFFDTGSGNTPHNANGVGWYFSADRSW